MRFENMRVNKLTKKHINYQDNRMNVKLAAPTLSLSVATALEMIQNVDK